MSEVGGWGGGEEEEERENVCVCVCERERARKREMKYAQKQTHTDEVATVIIPLLGVGVVGLTDLGQRFQNSVVQILLKVWQGGRFVVGN